MSAASVNRRDAALLIVDVQQKLTPHIDGSEAVVAATARLIRAARILKLPILVSEQYRTGLGPTVEPLATLLTDDPHIEKMTFSVCADENAMRRLNELQRSQVILAGIETHVCVQQTALDLLRTGLTPVLPVDAVGSRRPLDKDVAIERMRAAGVIVTTVESLIFELTHRAGTPEFRAILDIVK